MADKPRISIGMPVYNGERYIAEALESILGQTYTNFEVVIADNASTDRTEEICLAFGRRDPRVRYYRSQRNIGAAGNFNRVFAMGVGEYFKWAAHDDVLAPTYLARCVEALDRHPAAVMAHPRAQNMSPEGQRGSIFESFEGIGFWRLLNLEPEAIPAFVWGLMRRSALRKTRLIGSFVTADGVLVRELRLLGPFVEIPEVLFYLRGHTATAEWRERQTKRGEAAWFNPANQHRRLHPGITLFAQHLAGIWHLEISPLKKAWAYAAMGGYVACRLARSLRRGKLVRRVKEEFGWDAKFYGGPSAEPAPARDAAAVARECKRAAE